MTALATSGARQTSAYRAHATYGLDGGDYHGVHVLDELVEIAGLSMAAAAGETGANSRRALIDAFLAVASISQLVGDYVHRDFGDLNRIARYSSRLPGAAGTVAGGLIGSTARIGQRVRSRREADCSHWLAQIEDLSTRLAHALWSGSPGASRAALLQRWTQIAVSPDGLPGELVAVPPRCFFSFDQDPKDCLELAARFARGMDDRNRAVLVVGVRTSGCFMAPIVAAGLRATGFDDVGWISWRPGQPSLARDRVVVKWAVERKASILVVDDPPTSGGSIARVASELVDAGVARDRIMLLLQLFPDARRWETRLEAWPAIRIEWPDWQIHERLEETSIAADLSELLVGRELDAGEGFAPERTVVAAAVEDVTRLPTDSAEAPIRTGVARRHVLARYRVQIRAEDGARFSREISVKGVGLGMFGEHALAAARRLRSLVPEVYGVNDGLLFQEWVSELHAADESDHEQRQVLARSIGRYAANRAASLAVEADRSLQASAHDALWQQASRWLGAGFGRLALPLRPLLQASSRRLISGGRPSIIDAATGPGHWFLNGDTVLKTGWDEGAYVYQVPFSYDAAYDVALAAAQRLPDQAFGDAARAAYEEAGGGRIDDLRWFLYRLLGELDWQTRTRNQPLEEAASRKALIDSMTDGERRASGLYRGFLSEAYLHDVSPSQSGELCAIDIDGVIESAHPHYPAPSVASLLSLRALLVHGYRPVVATGRSLDEAVQRCRDYRLAGAVADYGAAIYDAASGRTEVLLNRDEVKDLETLRGALTRLEGIEVDGAYRHSVRAFTVRNSRRCAISDEDANRAIAVARLDGRIRTIQGWAQTDFAAAGVDKGSGLRVLAKRLGVEADPPLALAVGDSRSDIPMLALARIAAAPSNADVEVRTTLGVLRCSRRFGEGLAEAVHMLVGHSPGKCPKCLAPSMGGADGVLLLALLHVGDEHGLKKVPAIARALRAYARFARI